MLNRMRESSFCFRVYLIGSDMLSLLSFTLIVLFFKPKPVRATIPWVLVKPWPPVTRRSNPGAPVSGLQESVGLLVSG